LPNKVSLSLWGVPMEWYTTTEAVRNERFSFEEVPQGKAPGDLYIATNIQLLRDQKYFPDATLNIVLKTASGGSLYAARYYDTPGYWFDITVGKSIYLPNSFLREIRFVGDVGFLCWQTLGGYQNDAVMYGAKINLVTRKIDWETDYSGYMGWVGNGDVPNVLRTKLIFKHRNWRFFGLYQYGLHDYPYHQVRLGVTVDIAMPKK
jgi:hypothetical protein